MAYDDDDAIEEPASLRRLRLLVTVLTVVLIAGIVIIVAVIVIRLGGVADGPRAIDAEQIALPAGATIVSTGQGAGTVLFVLKAPDGVERLHVFDAETGERVSVTEITRDR